MSGPGLDPGDDELARAQHQVRRMEQVNREIHGHVAELRGQVQALAEALGWERTRRQEVEQTARAVLAEMFREWPPGVREKWEAELGNRSLVTALRNLDAVVNPPQPLDPDPQTGLIGGAA